MTLYQPRTKTPMRPVQQQAAEGFAAIAQGKADPSQTFGPLIDSMKTAEAPAPVSGPPVGATAAPAAPGGAPTALPVVDIPGTSKVERQAAALVQKYIGVNYVWGGESPKGFDCSGLLQYVWRSLGVNIPRVTYDQFQAGRAVPEGNLKPGDAVFFTGSDPKNGLPGHVGMYIGEGKFIEAPHTGAQVRVSTLSGRSDFVGARRYG